jgi:hypothetical protein
MGREGWSSDGRVAGGAGVVAVVAQRRTVERRSVCGGSGVDRLTVIELQDELDEIMDIRRLQGGNLIASVGDRKSKAWHVGEIAAPMVA